MFLRQKWIPWPSSPPVYLGSIFWEFSNWMIYSARSELQKSSQRFYESDDRCVFFASFDLRKFWTRLPRLAFTDGFVQLWAPQHSEVTLWLQLHQANSHITVEQWLKHVSNWCNVHHKFNNIQQGCREVCGCIKTSSTVHVSVRKRTESHFRHLYADEYFTKALVGVTICFRKYNFWPTSVIVLCCVQYVQLFIVLGWISTVQGC